MRRVTFAAIAVLLLALLWWQWPAGAVTPEHLSGPAATDAGATASATAGDVDEPSVEREALAAGADDERRGGERKQWTVRLTGIDPNVPWTSKLTLIVEQRRYIDVEIDADGVGTFEPPSMARNPAFQLLAVVANDPNYRVVRPRTRMDNLQMHGEDAFAVRPIAWLRGRVLRPEGLDTELRVRAFPLTDNGPAEAEVSRARPDPNGNYELWVPPNTPVLVLADALPLASGPFSGFAPDPQRNPFHVDDFFNEPQSFDTRVSQVQIVPANLVAEGSFGAPRDLADLVLSRAARLTGRVVLQDGAAVAGVHCITAPANGAQRWRDLMHWTGSRVLVSPWSKTDANGQFSVWLPPGVPFQVTATSSNPLMLAGEPQQRASAPGHVQLTVPGELVTIEVVRDNRPMAAATVSIDRMELRADARGRLAVTLAERAVRVQARTPELISKAVDIPANNRPSLVQLQLEPEQRTTASVTLRAARPLLQAGFAWHPVDRSPSRTMTPQRASNDDPFVMRLPPGDYQLHVHASPEGRAGRYVMLHEQTVTVPPGGFAATYDVAFGGRLQLSVADKNDTPVAATFTLRNAAGEVLTPQTHATGAVGGDRISGPGELAPTRVNELLDVLPAGRYQLAVDPGAGRAVQHRTVTITAAQTQWLRVQLP